MDDRCIMTSKLEAPGGCLSHYLQGQVARLVKSISCWPNNILQHAWVSFPISVWK